MRRLKKLLLWLVTGSTGFILSACYGTMAPYSETTLDLTVTIKNNMNQPVSNINCQLLDSGYVETYGRTDADGTFKTNIVIYGSQSTALSTLKGYTINLSDPDGTNNGSYSSTNVAADTNVTVTLTEAP